MGFRPFFQVKAFLGLWAFRAFVGLYGVGQRLTFQLLVKANPKTPDTLMKVTTHISLGPCGELGLGFSAKAEVLYHYPRIC